MSRVTRRSRRSSLPITSRDATCPITRVFLAGPGSSCGPGPEVALKSCRPRTRGRRSPTRSGDSETHGSARRRGTRFDSQLADTASTMSFGGLLKAFDTIVLLREAARRFKGPDRPSPGEPGGVPVPSPPTALTGQIEARLTGVVVAALKEAFDRDHARLELERAQLEEQRLRAEEAMRAELRRQTADREVGRLRLIAGTALVGWIAAVALLVVRLGDASTLSRAVSAGGWLLLLAALGTAFMAQGRVSASVTERTATVEAGQTGMIALWLLIAGLAAAAIALLF